MGRRNLHIAWNSISFKLVVSFLIVTIPLIVLLLYNNFYAIHVVRDEVAISNKNMMSLYMGQIDNGLQEVDKYLNSLVSSNLDVQTMENARSDDDYMLSKVHLSDRVSADILMYKVDSFFIYSSPRKDILDVFQTSNPQEAVRSYIRNKLSVDQNLGQPPYNSWDVKKIGQDYYLFRIQKLGHTFVGAWVKAKTLILPLTLIHLGENGFSLFITDRGEPMTSTIPIAAKNIDLSRSLEKYYLTGDKNEYLIAGEKSKKGNFSLVALIPNKTILQNLPYLNQIVVVISFLGLLLLPGFLLFLRKTVLIPLKRITSVMKRIGDGNVNVRIEQYPTSDEFHLVNMAFNKMMTQIEELKINVYEEHLNKQKAELQHLQLQINPHFFLNTLNILYNLALVQDYELIKEMALRLVSHFRFMFKSNLTFVPLNEELEHVRNYIRIQELRFQQTLTCEIQTPDTFAMIHVPPLIIQTFIENSVKHAATMDGMLYLFIQIDVEDSQWDPHIRITIRDTGKGFTEEVLSELRAGNRIIDEQGEHIGIWNVWHRLRLLYGNRAQLVFSNDYTSGAIVEIKLPLQTKIME